MGAKTCDIVACGPSELAKYDPTFSLFDAPYVFNDGDSMVAFANSDANLNEMDSSLNRSKGDKSMTDWLDNPNSRGQKPDEIFDISAEDEAKMRLKNRKNYYFPFLYLLQ